MGAYLSRPNTQKESKYGSNSFISYGASSMQGWRRFQEDTHNCLLNFDEKRSAAYFAVYDGHGGAEVAKYCSLYLPNYILSQPQYSTANELNLEEFLKRAFVNFDETLLSSEVQVKLKQMISSDGECLEYLPSNDELSKEDSQGDADSPQPDFAKTNKSSSPQYDEQLASQDSIKSNREGCDSAVSESGATLRIIEDKDTLDVSISTVSSASPLDKNARISNSSEGLRTPISADICDNEGQPTVAASQNNLMTRAELIAINKQPVLPENGKDRRAPFDVMSVSFCDIVTKQKATESAADTNSTFEGGGEEIDADVTYEMDDDANLSAFSKSLTSQVDCKERQESFSVDAVSGCDYVNEAELAEVADKSDRFSADCVRDVMEADSFVVDGDAILNASNKSQTSQYFDHLQQSFDNNTISDCDSLKEKHLDYIAAEKDKRFAAEDSGQESDGDGVDGSVDLSALNESIASQKRFGDRQESFENDTISDFDSVKEQQVVDIAAEKENNFSSEDAGQENNNDDVYDSGDLGALNKSINSQKIFKDRQESFDNDIISDIESVKEQHVDAIVAEKGKNSTFEDAVKEIDDNADVDYNAELSASSKSLSFTENFEDLQESVENDISTEKDKHFAAEDAGQESDDGYVDDSEERDTLSQVITSQKTFDDPHKSFENDIDSFKKQQVEDISTEKGENSASEDAGKESDDVDDNAGLSALSKSLSSPENFEDQESFENDSISDYDYVNEQDVADVISEEENSFGVEDDEEKIDDGREEIEGDKEEIDLDGREIGDDEDMDEDDYPADQVPFIKPLGYIEPGVDSGTTACTAIIIPQLDESGMQKKVFLYVANAGDTRAVLCRARAAVDLSVDHKPEDAKEKNRIVAAGGFITADGRVNDGLNLSRALGDHAYKLRTDLDMTEQMISALPDVSCTELLPGSDEFVVIACDGIWNSMSSQDVVDFIYDHLHHPNSPPPSASARIENRPEVDVDTSSPEFLASICEALFDHCLAPNTLGDGTGCDNMTCIILRFDNLDALALSATLKKSQKTLLDPLAISSSANKKITCLPKISNRCSNTSPSDGDFESVGHPTLVSHDMSASNSCEFSLLPKESSKPLPDTLPISSLTNNQTKFSRKISPQCPFTSPSAGDFQTVEHPNLVSQNLLSSKSCEFSPLRKKRRTSVEVSPRKCI